MAILSIYRDWGPAEGPSIVRMTTDDAYATMTTAGYLTDEAANIAALNSGAFEWKANDVVLASYTGDARAWFTPSSDYADLDPLADAGEVVLPVTANHIAAFTNTEGAIGDDPATAINGGNIQAGLSGTAGYLASFPTTAAQGSLRFTAVDNTGDTITTVSNAAMGQASVISIPDPGQATAEFIISDSAGTQNITSGSLQVDAGNFVAGIDASAGYFEAHPATTNSGTFRVQATDSSTDSIVAITNADHGQATTYSIPDVGAATGEVIVKTAALVSGNVVHASGTAGVIVDGGYNMLAATTAAYGGGGTSNAFTATGLLATDVVSCQIRAQTNTASIVSAVPTTDTLTVTFSADPGAATTVDWVAYRG